jgi:hypothetical protein
MRSRFLNATEEVEAVQWFLAQGIAGMIGD